MRIMSEENAPPFNVVHAIVGVFRMGHTHEQRIAHFDKDTKFRDVLHVIIQQTTSLHEYMDKLCDEISNSNAG